MTKNKIILCQKCKKEMVKKDIDKLICWEKLEILTHTNINYGFKFKENDFQNPLKIKNIMSVCGLIIKMYDYYECEEDGNFQFVRRGLF